MTPAQPQLFAAPAGPWTEKDWRTKIMRALARNGYRANHCYTIQDRTGRWRTPTTSPGFPDILAFGRGITLAIECKMPKGVIHPDQLEWLEAVYDNGGFAWVLTPRDNGPRLGRWLARPIETANRCYGWVRRGEVAAQ